MQNVLIALIGLLVLRNFMRTDYREEGLKHLKEVSKLPFTIVIRRKRLTGFVRSIRTRVG